MNGRSSVLLEVKFKSVEVDSVAQEAEDRFEHAW